MYHLCGRIEGWMEVRVHICFTCVFHRCLIKDSWMVACVWVYVCVHVHISMYRLGGRRMSQKCECADVFACVFHRCLIKDSWMVACVGVYVCVHISMYRLCGRVEG
jgi:hypothetical protein